MAIWATGSAVSVPGVWGDKLLAAPRAIHPHVFLPLEGQVCSHLLAREEVEAPTWILFWMKESAMRKPLAKT